MSQEENQLYLSSISGASKQPLLVEVEGYKSKKKSEKPLKMSAKVSLHKDIPNDEDATKSGKNEAVINLDTMNSGSGSIQKFVNPNSSGFNSIPESVMTDKKDL